MTDKQILDRLSGININIAQKKAIIDIIKDVAANNKSSIIINHVADIEVNKFQLYINNKLYNLRKYDHYSQNEYAILDSELFNLFNTWSTINIYVAIGEIYKIYSPICKLVYFNITDTEEFILSYTGNNNSFEEVEYIIHICKQ